MNYKIEFLGSNIKTKKPIQPIVKHLAARNELEARLRLYDEYQQISGIKISIWSICRQPQTITGIKQ